MFHYLFTNDLRISNLESFLIEAARCFKEDRVPSATVDKNANNNMNTLGFYFNLTKDSKCTAECVNGNVRKVVLNFIKKFQFPNPRTTASLKDCIDDNIQLAPMRVILQTLYMMQMMAPEHAFLTKREIADNIFFNEAVAKTSKPDIAKLVTDIIANRAIKDDQPIPEDDVLESKGFFWKQCRRQVREMVKVLCWSGCVEEDEDGIIKIHHDNLSRDNEADIFEIITFHGFWVPKKDKNAEENKASYQKYMDIDTVTVTSVTPNFVALTPEWFKDKAKDFQNEEAEAASMYVDFESKYGVDALNALAGEELLKALFLGGNPDNLCHELEYVDRNRDLFGSIKGGNAYKYPMFFDKEANAWVTGSRYNPKQLTLAEAIIKGTAVRDGLVAAVAAIKETESLESVEDYLSLYSKLYGIIPEIIDSIWVSKYFHMLFPNLFPVFYNKDWQVRVLTTLKKEPNDTMYGRFGQIIGFVKECDISNVAFGKVYHKYCRNIVVDQPEDDVVEEVEIKRLTGGENIILYGVPGAGKSYTIKHEYCKDDACIERLVFHPDYTYSDFVGQILPRISEDGTVNYEFMPGPFTKLLRKAYVNPGMMFYLVIEEVNRGNAPAIFGDIFQLLDRDKDGKSEYEITNADIAKIVYQSDSHKVSIPSNMSILCTMNTSDQNVFTLDTAFQRRWNMRLIKNKFGDAEEEKKFAGTKILDTDVTWEHFFTSINKIILDKNIRMTSSEDKRLGTHFVAEEDLEYIEGNERHNRKFPEKVLKYLWDDAFKFTKEDIFDLEKVKSLEDVIEMFIGNEKNDRFRVFKENIYKTLVPQQA